MSSYEHYKAHGHGRLIVGQHTLIMLDLFTHKSSHLPPVSRLRLQYVLWLAGSPKVSGIKITSALHSICRMRDI